MFKCPLDDCSFQSTNLEDLYEHAKNNKKHANIKWSSTLAYKVGGLACSCGTLIKNKIGYQIHLRKSTNNNNNNNNNCNLLSNPAITISTELQPTTLSTSSSKIKTLPTITTTTTRSSNLFKATISSRSKISTLSTLHASSNNLPTKFNESTKSNSLIILTNQKPLSVLSINPSLTSSPTIKTILDTRTKKSLTPIQINSSIALSTTKSALQTLQLESSNHNISPPPSHLNINSLVQVPSTSIPSTILLQALPITSSSENLSNSISQSLSSPNLNEIPLPSDNQYITSFPGPFSEFSSASSSPPTLPSENLPPVSFDSSPISHPALLSPAQLHNDSSSHALIISVPSENTSLSSIHTPVVSSPGSNSSTSFKTLLLFHPSSIVSPAAINSPSSIISSPITSTTTSSLSNSDSHQSLQFSCTTASSPLAQSDTVSISSPSSRSTTTSFSNSPEDHTLSPSASNKSSSNTSSPPSSSSSISSLSSLAKTSSTSSPISSITPTDYNSETSSATSIIIISSPSSTLSTSSGGASEIIVVAEEEELNISTSSDSQHDPTFTTPIKSTYLLNEPLSHRSFYTAIQSPSSTRSSPITSSCSSRLLSRTPRPVFNSSPSVHRPTLNKDSVYTYDDNQQQVLDNNNLPTEDISIASVNATPQIICPIHLCFSRLKSLDGLYDHARKKHKDTFWNASLASKVGGVACPCGALCKSKQGIMRHKSLTNCKITNVDVSNNNHSSSLIRDVEPVEATNTIATVSARIKTTASINNEDSLPMNNINKRWKNLLLELDKSNTDTSSSDYMDLFYALAHIPTSTVQCLPMSVHKEFLNCLDKLCENYISNSNEINLLLILALPKLGLCPIITKGNVSSIRKRLQAYPNVEWPDFNLLLRNKDKRYKRPNTQQSATVVSPTTADFSVSTSSTATVSQQDVKISLIKKAIIKGNISRASRLLNDEPFTISSDNDTYDKLEKLHPDGSKDLLAINNKLTKGSTPFELEPEIIKMTALSMPRHTGVGISGWTTSLIINSIKEDNSDSTSTSTSAASSSSSTFLNFLIILTRQILAGSAPGARMLCSARLIPIKKDNGKIRPIAVGELFYRIASKAIFKRCRYQDIKNKNKDLLDFQLGVSTPGGVEPIIFQIEKYWKRFNSINSNTTSTNMNTTNNSSKSRTSDEDKTFTGVGFVDLANAFNNISRSTILDSIKNYNPKIERFFRWSYGTSTPLIVDVDTDRCGCLYCNGIPASLNNINNNNNNKSNIIWSSQGVRQGDPLGPYLFSLGFRKILQEIESDKSKILTYIDDTTILCQDKSEYDEILSKLNSVSASDMGIHVNLDKCSYYHFTDIGYHDDQYNCIELLGSCIGSKHNRGKFLRNKIDILLNKVDKLRQLTSQEGLLLLSHGLIHELKHLQRSLDTTDNLPEWNRLDSYLIKYIKALRGGIDLDNGPKTAMKTKNVVQSSQINNRTYFEDIIINLPLRYGGLGIPSFEKTLNIVRTSALEADQARNSLYDISITTPDTTMAQNSVIISSDTNNSISSQYISDIVDPKKKAKIKMNYLYESQLTKLFQVMDEHLKTEFVDLNSKVSKAWLYKTSIPNNRYRLSNKVVSSYLKAKTLYQESNYCYRCGTKMNKDNNSNLSLLFINSFNAHAECCTKNENFKVARHELLKKCLAKTLSRSNKVTIEPFINKNSSGLRADLSVAGPAAINGTLNLIDLSVVSLNSIRAQNKKTDNNKDTNNTNNYNYKQDIDNILSRINQILDIRHQDKIKKYQHLTDIQLTTFIISPGGSLHPESLQLLSRIGNPNKQSINQLYTELSFILTRCRGWIF